jgi:hypothetical protein
MIPAARRFEPRPGHPSTTCWDQNNPLGNPGAIMQANLDGTNQQSIVTGSIPFRGIAANSSNLYWIDREAAPSTITEANLDGTHQHTIVTGQNGPDFVAVSP